jgi:translation elongation factor EF-Tu-like GTPase
MAREKFERTKPHVNIGTWSRRSWKTTLTLQANCGFGIRGGAG